MTTPGSVPRSWLGFNCISSENYELDLNFEKTDIKRQSYHSSDDKVGFLENIVFIEE